MAKNKALLGWFFIMCLFLFACEEISPPEPTDEPSPTTAPVLDPSPTPEPPQEPEQEPTPTTSPYLLVLEYSRLVSLYRRGAFGAAGDLVAQDRIPDSLVAKLGNPQPGQDQLLLLDGLLQEAELTVQE